MAHIILTGATGLVGSGVLSSILSAPPGQIARVSVLSRKPVPMAQRPEAKAKGVEVIEHKDFSQFPPELLDKLKGADGVVWALGVSQLQVNKQ